mgnify:CR=1 FL=1
MVPALEAIGIDLVRAHEKVTNEIEVVPESSGPLAQIAGHLDAAMEILTAFNNSLPPE